jgi:hypothetical protein
VTLWIEIGGRLRKVELPTALNTASAGSQSDGAMRCHVDGRRFAVEARLLAPGVMSLLLLDEHDGGRQLRCVLEPRPRATRSSSMEIACHLS